MAVHSKRPAGQGQVQGLNGQGEARKPPADQVHNNCIANCKISMRHPHCSPGNVPTPATLMDLRYPLSRLVSKCEIACINTVIIRSWTPGYQARPMWDTWVPGQAHCRGHHAVLLVSPYCIITPIVSRILVPATMLSPLSLHPHLYPTTPPPRSS